MKGKDGIYIDMQLDNENRFTLDGLSAVLIMIVVLAILAFWYVGLRLNYEIAFRMDKIIKLDEQVKAMKAKLPDGEHTGGNNPEKKTHQQSSCTPIRLLAELPMEFCKSSFF